MADELNPTEQMHKFAVDQINEFKRINKEEREHKNAVAKKEAEEIKAKVEKKHAQEIEQV